MANTSIQNLERRISRLQETHPNSRLLQDYKKQLAEWKANPAGSAQETYFSGRPMGNSASPQSAKPAKNPMQPAVDSYEQGLKELFDRQPGATPSTPPESTTPTPDAES